MGGLHRVMLCKLLALIFYQCLHCWLVYISRYKHLCAVKKKLEGNAGVIEVAFYARLSRNGVCQLLVGV